MSRTELSIHAGYKVTLNISVADHYPDRDNVNCVSLQFGDTTVILFNLDIATAEALCMAARLDMARVKRESELAKSEAESDE